LLQLLTAGLVLQHGPHRLFHPGNKQDYEFPKQCLFDVSTRSVGQEAGKRHFCFTHSH
jgi:hypothetical protein